MIRRASIYSILAEVLFIGSPLYVDEPITSEKFEKFFSHTNELLGFIIDTRKMVVQYPQDKNDDLLFLLNQELWKIGRTHRVRHLASILGKLRNLGQILHFGVRLFINLQLSLPSFIKTSIVQVTKTSHATMRSTMRAIWNPYRRLHLSRQAIEDLQFLSNLLSTSPDHIWCRPVSLVIARDSNFLAYSDAYNNGIGGYSTILDFQWRDLIHTIYTDRELHINTKEFVALFINVYLAMISFIHIRKNNLLQQDIRNLDGYIFSFLCDNTAAISWMTHSSRSHDDKAITRLTHSLSLLIYNFNSILPANFIPKHIQGEQNIEADALSRQILHPTYSALFLACPLLKTIQPLRLPSKLISLLRGLISGQSAKEQTERTMKKLLLFDVTSLRLTVKNWECIALV